MWYSLDMASEDNHTHLAKTLARLTGDDCLGGVLKSLPHPVDLKFSARSHKMDGRARW